MTTTISDRDVRSGSITPFQVEGESDVVRRIRARAAARFNILGWPTTRIEEWKYTSLASLTRINWRLDAGHPNEDVPAGFGEAALGELVFVNGVLHRKSGVAALHEAQGFTILPLSAAMGRDLFTAHFSRYADDERQALTAMNTALARDGGYIEIAPGTVMRGYIHLLFAGDSSAEEAVMSQVRNLIVVGRGSQVTVVESYVGRGTYFTNTVTEIFAGEGSVVDHYKVQYESPEAFHIGTVQIHQERASSVTSRSVAIGGGLVRNQTNVALSGDGASVVLDGLFVGTGTQHIDNQTVIDHIKPHCESLELYKGILDGKARGIFDGKIIVRPDAQKTVSRQTNNNLLLSGTAIVDSKPTLEILNDDVKCNHGSTIGQLDEEALFYLQSRGLSESEARRLLVHAFASVLVDRMKVEPVRERIRSLLFTTMPNRLPERREEER
jgi:Fe-S cluster assembly protein SufD